MLGQAFIDDLGHFVDIQRGKNRLVDPHVGTVGRLGDFLNIRLSARVLLHISTHSMTLATQRHRSTQHDILSAAYKLKPAAVETHRPMDEATISFISQLGRKISEYSGDPFRYFFQRVSVLIQRCNSILFRDNFPAVDEIDM